MADKWEQPPAGAGDRNMNRREFCRRTVLAAGVMTAAAALPEPFAVLNAYSAQVDPNDPALTSADVKFSSVDGTAVTGYIARPRDNAQHAAVVVIHENRGLTDHIRDIARRLANAGYVALAPDLLSRQGGTGSFPNEEAATAGIGKLTEQGITADLTGAVNYLKRQTFVRPNKIGVTGFCWGGGNTLLIATRDKDLAAVVVYYGRNPKNLDDVQNINAPVLAHYGELDKGITPQLPNLEQAMKKYGKSFEYKIYPGAPHAFNNDTNAERYRPEAAKEAWSRTLAFFKAHLQD